MKPILFNSDMVRAILDERKTCTRRVVKPQPKDAYAIIDSDDETHTFDLLCGNRVAGGLLADWAETVKAPYWPGDFLYVRETWTARSRTMGTPPVLYYKADGNAPDGIKWRPSIHMPKEAARIFLRVTNVRVEHLQDITEEQAVAEGALPVYLSVDSEDTPYSDRTWHEVVPARPDFIRIWDSTIKPADRPLYGWRANPWVWVIEFERCETSK